MSACRCCAAARPLKRWRYVGVFCEELMACAALVQVGPARQSFWALYTRADGRLRERTRMLVRRGAVELPRGRAASDRRDARPTACSICDARGRTSGRSEAARVAHGAGEGVDTQAGGRARAWDAHARRRLAAGDRGAGGDRRHRRLSRPRHRVVVERRGGHGRGRRGARVEPGGRRQRPADGQRARGVGRWRADARRRRCASPRT